MGNGGSATALSVDREGPCIADDADDADRSSSIRRSALNEPGRTDLCYALGKPLREEAGSLAP